jgi:hypothetical protein
MKHHVCTVLLLASFVLCAEFDKYALFGKVYRIGRFNDEDSFDINQVETILKQLPVAAQKNIEKLFGSTDKNGVSQPLLLLGGIRNADTTAVAKAIALHWGYDYYLIEASAFLQASNEKQDSLLSEARAISKQKKPIVFIITELPEMEDYFALHACDLRMLIDQCAQYPNVMVIATSAFREEQLSDSVKQRFNTIVSIESHEEQPKISWLERNKTACIVASGFVCCALVAVSVGTYILSATMQLEQCNQNALLHQQITDLLGEVSSLKQKYKEQNESFQKKHTDMQQRLNKL